MSESENKTDKTSNGPGKESFVERVGLVGLLGGAAALITAIATLIAAFNKHDDRQPQTPPQAVAAANPAAVSGDNGFAVNDYWSGIPDGTRQPLIFHVSADSKGVFGTMRNPCQSDFVLPIDSGTWDGSRLVVHVSKTGSKVPVMLDVNRAGDRLEGSLTQVPYDGHITLRRGEVPCPEGQAGKPQEPKPAKKN
jgi:hypothetical protein